MEPTDTTPSKPNDYFNRLEVDGEDEYIDHWDTGELLFLASSVLRSDRNWVSVARSIKPFGEQTRPTDWYTPKNCALQYTKLLNEIEEDSKKKTLPRTERETSEVMLVKNLTDKRLNELGWLNQQTKVTSNILKTYIEMVETGDFDEHLDDLLKQIDEKEKAEEESYNEYMSKRETLNTTKKLNKSRITKGKAVTKAADAKKKLSFSELSAESPHATVEAVIKNIKREMDSEEEAKPVIKSEPDVPITLNALLDSKVTIPSSVAPTSPLLTSLLRSFGSTTPSSHTLSSVSSHLKETSLTDCVKGEVDSKSKEISPRQSVPQSPRPTPASSPLLNSLLKNSPSSTTPIQMSPVKEISPKAVSSPQPFFNPSNVLATAAAQQIALATSTHPHSHQYFQQPDTPSETRKSGLQISPVTSACLAAPTLSALLEMPPSTPGRLPPLPVLDPPVAATSVSTPIPTPEPAPTPPKASTHQIVEVELKPNESLQKRTPTKSSPGCVFPSETSVLQKSLASYSLLDKKSVAASCSEDKVDLEDIKPSLESLENLESIAHENIEILDAVAESINHAFEIKEMNKEIIETEEIELQEIQIDSMSPILNAAIKVENVAMEEEVSSYVVEEELVEKSVENSSTADANSPDQIISELLESPSTKTSDFVTETEKSEDKAVTSKKFYKSRVGGKKEESVEKSDHNPFFQSPKELAPSSADLESSSPNFSNDSFFPASRDEERLSDKQDSNSVNSSDLKSPPPKKQKLFERSSTEKAELSEDEAPLVAVRRSGRRGKKGRGRIARNTPVKQAEPKDQYEFTESTEENSMGYQVSNTLCYMPRVKEDSRSDDSKHKLSQDSADATAASGSPTDKKVSTPLRLKQARGGSHANAARRSLFMSDEDRMSDSITSDDASNHLLSEDKLKKWDESCSSKAEGGKSSTEATKRGCKASESAKKKPVAAKRSSTGKTISTRKERKSSNIDMEELSAGSRDSEEMSLQDKNSLTEKDSLATESVDMEVETTDSRVSSNAAESDKQVVDDGEGCESLQGSITTDLSPPTESEGKEASKDWFQTVSPKSSEHISQSSEESEGSDWDNHSASTNKSASQSTDRPRRMRRKERETPQYKAWKKAISIVLREASCHKNANIFLQKVTNDVAPGYLSIVHKPMDLSLIKKNIDTGVIRTTEQFHRDMLIMFQNAIMYNSSDHDVHQMAVEMQRDVVQQIFAFLTTQNNDKDETSEPVSSLRGARGAKSQKGLGKESTRSSSGKVKEETD